METPEFKKMEDHKLLQHYDLLNNFIKRGKEKIAKDGKFLGLDVSDVNDLQKITKLMQEREAYIALVRKEILARMELSE